MRNDIFLNLRPFMLTLYNMKKELDNGKAEKGKLETGKLETGKLETGKLETGKLETAKLETAKLETVKLETGNLKPLQKFFMPKARPPPLEKIPEKSKISTDKVVIHKPDNRFFSPKQKDSLFWCYYIIKNGFSSYEYPGTTTFAREKEIKFEYITILRLAKQLLKSKKIKNLREHVEDELGNKEKIGMKTFIALCVASNTNVLFIHKRKCFELILVEDEPVYVIHQKDTNGVKNFMIETDVSKDNLDMYKETYFKWESLDKPLKAPSAYKLDELQKLCVKAGVKNDGKKKTKKELYDLLLLEI